jgi:branched-chain amino acid transport system permease protein
MTTTAVDHRRVSQHYRPWIAGGVTIMVVVLVPWLTQTPTFRLSQFDQILSLLVVAIALNVATGFAGQFLLGIPAVFAVGAYAAVTVAKHHPAGVGLVVMCVIGCVVGGVAGAVIGLPALRVAGFYLAMVSLYATLVVPAVAEHVNYVGGAVGIPLFIVPGFDPQLSGIGLYITFVAIVIGVCGTSWCLRHSTIGRRFDAISASGELATSLGISGYRTKLLASVLASVIAGGAGGMYVYSQAFFAPGSTSPTTAVLLLASIVIGGSGSVLGPVVGGAIVLGLNQFLPGLHEYTGAVFGALLLIFALVLPDGLLAEATKLLRGRHERHGTVEFAESVSAKGEAHPIAIAPLEQSGEPPTMEILDVSRRFGGVKAVDSVDLTVCPGAIHGLIGSNGSGKTTLLNLISGFYTVDSGAIKIGSVTLTDLPAYRRSSAGVARTFQSPKLVLKLSALENVVTAAERRSHTSGLESVFRLPRGRKANAAARQEALTLLDMLGIGALRDVEAGALPHGTRRLVEMARLIACHPRFVLLDEPASGLSPTELDILAEVIRALARSGVGVLLIEHNIPLVLELASEVTVMHQGRRLFQGTADELRDNEEVASAFLGLESSTAEDL